MVEAAGGVTTMPDSYTVAFVVFLIIALGLITWWIQRLPNEQRHALENKVGGAMQLIGWWLVLPIALVGAVIALWNYLWTLPEVTGRWDALTMQGRYFGGAAALTLIVLTRPMVRTVLTDLVALVGALVVGYWVALGVSTPS